MEIKNTFIEVHSNEEKLKAIELYQALGAKLTGWSSPQRWIEEHPVKRPGNCVYVSSEGELNGDHLRCMGGKKRIAISIKHFETLVEDFLKPSADGTIQIGDKVRWLGDPGRWWDVMGTYTVLSIPRPGFIVISSKLEERCVEWPHDYFEKVEPNQPKIDYFSTTPTEIDHTTYPLPDQYTERDISTEEWREYVWQSFGEKQVVRIDNPVKLITRKGGKTHRVVDAAGLTYCVPAPETCGVCLIWKSKDKKKPVNF